MRVKFFILAVGMLAYGWYMHSFAERAQLQMAQMQRSYEQAVSYANQQ